MIKGMKRVVLFFLLLLFPLASHALTLKDKLLQATVGDFVVTEQNKIYSILVVRNVSKDSIELEEISIPASNINLAKTSWRKWIDKKAPGSTSWMLYQIDFVEEKLTESYSFSQKKWLYADTTDYLLAKLLTLDLERISEKEQRRIGPPPADNEHDRRAVWKPKMIREGGRVKQPQFDVYSSKWPKDDSQLSECNILFYFDADHPSFPFPYWLELSNGYISLKLRTIDSGSTLETPLAHTPLPPHFNFSGPMQSLKEGQRLTLMTMSENPHLELFARDLTTTDTPLIPINYTLTPANHLRSIHFDIPKKLLSSTLTPGHKYQWIVRSKRRPSMSVESYDYFTWKDK